MESPSESSSEIGSLAVPVLALEAAAGVRRADSPRREAEVDGPGPGVGFFSGAIRKRESVSCSGSTRRERWRDLGFFAESLKSMPVRSVSSTAEVERLERFVSEREDGRRGRGGGDTMTTARVVAVDLPLLFDRVRRWFSGVAGGEGVASIRISSSVGASWRREEGMVGHLPPRGRGAWGPGWQKEALSIRGRVQC